MALSIAKRIDCARHGCLGYHRDAILVKTTKCSFGMRNAEFEYLTGGQYYSIDVLFELKDSPWPDCH
jgi:hypothetical protein